MALEAAARQRLATRSRTTTRRPRLPLADWERRYLPAHFPLAASSFHRWLLGELDSLHERRGTRLDVVAPRGAAKSTHSSLAYVLYAAVEKLEHYVQIISDTRDQAWVWLEAVREELEGNARLAADYPDATGIGPTWRKDRLRLRNGVVVEALGTGSKMRGRRHQQHRPSLRVIDDPENDEHVTSPLRRERSWRWFTRAALNGGTAATNVIVLGTALHRDCLVLRLSRTGGWKHRLFKALPRMPGRMDLWQEWERLYTTYDDPEREATARAFYDGNRAEMDAGAELLWPEKEPLLDLMALRVTIGHAAFESEKQGSPVNPEACEWPEDYFDGPGFWAEPEAWPKQFVVSAMALDPSKGRDARTGDYSAYVFVGVDKDGVLWLDADLARRPTPRMVEDGIALYARWGKPTAFAVEVNQYQSLLGPEFIRAMKLNSLVLPLYGWNNSENKEVRIRRPGPYLAQRRVRVRRGSPGAALLVQQARDFPVGDFDDGIDAAELAIRQCNHLVYGHAEGTGPELLRA
jgi:predicted phage terminase large subunit-like protein